MTDHDRPRLPAIRFIAGALALTTVSACAAGDRPATPVAAPATEESISYEVGPCFGFCPVYNASITASGLVAFEGVRHTATLGSKTLRKDAATYSRFAAALASWRPATGTTADTQCDAQISDQQHYRITWTAADGTKTVLQHDRGCRSPANDALNAALQAAPDQLGIADWAKQTTRPGVSRG